MSSVRGPNSALTEFLRSQGINANEIRDRHERRQQAAAHARRNPGEDAAEEAPAVPASAQTNDPELQRIAEAAAAKRRADDDVSNEGTDKCAYCNTQFTLSVYTTTTKDGGVLCRPCGAKNKSAKARKPGVQARKKQKLLANALLDMKNDLSPSLQDICISTVAKYIDDVDELGDLTAQNFEKIANILTKNRRLTPKTVQLFLRNDVTTLNFADCSQLTPEAYNLVASMCPQLERLTMEMCGQLDDEGLDRLAALPHLTELCLDGPFQVRVDAWINLFETVGDRLKTFEIKSVYRFTAEALAVMATNCTALERLSLVRLTQLKEATPLYMLTELKNLRHLELAQFEDGLVTDEPIIAILQVLGPQLETLVLRDLSLTDATIDVIARECKHLQRLELVNLTGITDDAVAAMFNTWTAQESNMNITTLSFERCIGVGDRSIEAVLAHCHGSLVELNLNSLKTLHPDFITPVSKLPNLNKLDIGFMSGIEPFHVYKLSTSNLKLLLVFGNIRLSRMPLPENLTVVGTM